MVEIDYTEPIKSKKTVAIRCMLKIYSKKLEQAALK